MGEVTERDRHIAASGGGGLSMEPDNPPLDDDVVGADIAEVVASRRAAGAYRVEAVAGQVVETRLPSRQLGA